MERQGIRTDLNIVAKMRESIDEKDKGLAKENTHIKQNLKN